MAARSDSTAKNRAESRAFQKAAVDLLIRLHIVTKNARIYKPNNQMFLNQVKACLESLIKFLDDDGEASFRVRQSALYLNGTRLKFILGTYPIFKFILEEFRDREIGALTFLPELTLDELVSFVSAFGKKDKNDATPFDTLLANLADAGIEHVQPEKVLATETFSSLHQDTARIFFLSILHLKECFERDKRNESIKISTTRRLMQSIFNHIVDNESFVYGLTNLKNFDEYTLNHSVNVCMLAIALGRRLGLSRGELVDLGVASFLHDLGKLETPLEILNKPTQLSDDEWRIMELHPQQGAEKLLHLKDFKRLPLRAVHVALEHHIKEDLSGYPHYFKRDDVNLFSKIVKVVDYFDAVTTKRVYRSTVLTRAEALSLMLEKSGTEFNAVILKAFVNLMGVFPVGTLVALTSGELGIVFETNPDPKLILRPKVKLITDSEGNRLDGETVDLSERDPEAATFPRTIAKALHPDTYGIEVADYFLAQAQ
jgi:HD-GYP domain-containing protein (c-di-GMP phosphodiesterase class II)